MRVRLLAVSAGVLLPLTLAGPAAAVPGAKHGSCERFGHSWAMWAQGELPAEFGSPGTVMPELAQTEPGAAAAFLHLEMTTEIEGIPGTPACDPHPQE